MSSAGTTAWLTLSTQTTGPNSSRRRGARSIPVVDGFELLVGQGALSFERFTGLPAPVDAMRAAVRQT